MSQLLTLAAIDRFLNETMSNDTTTSEEHVEDDEDGSSPYDKEYEQFAFMLVALLFGVVTVLGCIGNLLVILVVALNQQMRSTTNLLIIR